LFLLKNSFHALLLVRKILPRSNFLSK
jgi:hypothetical protein